jgi:uncharacterized protein YggE
MKRLLLILGMVLMAYGVSAQQAVSVKRVVAVVGEAKRSVTPDEFTINLTLMEGDGKGDKLTVVEKHKRLVAELKRVGIDPSALKTDDVSNSRYKRKDVRTTINYELKLVGFESVARAFDAFDAAGVRQAWLASSKYSEEAKVREELMGEAVRNAHRMAEILADAAGVELGAPMSIEMPSVRTYAGVLRATNYKATVDAATESMAELNLEVRDIEMSTQVNVTYELVIGE